jgi:hypothetical protein
MQTFHSWAEIAEHCHLQTHYHAFSGAGICPRGASTCILKSVDHTPYYDDNLDNPENPKYTLFGRIGDQDIHEKRYNSKLIHAQNIYLYRKTYNKTYIWYGKYKIQNVTPKHHQDINGQLRIIYIVSLIR